MHRLDDHHRVVDDEADRDGEPAQRHQIERLAEAAQDEERRPQGQRQRGGGEQRRPDVPQEEGQHQHGEERAEEHRIAHAAHGVGDEVRLLVDGFQLDAGGQRGLELEEPRVDRRVERQNIAAGAPGDVEDHARLSVDADQGGAGRGSRRHRPEVHDPQRRLRRAARHHLADVLGRAQFAGDDAQRLLVFS